jgi:hypothetical protein
MTFFKRFSGAGQTQTMRAVGSPEILGNYASLVEKYLLGMSVDVAKARKYLDNGFLYQFYFGSARIEVGIIRREKSKLGAQDVIQVYSPILHVPEGTLVAFYRRLLEENINLSQASFAINGDVVFVYSERSLADLSADELKELVEAVALVADAKDNELADEFGARLYQQA